MKLPLDILSPQAAGTLASMVHEARAAGNRTADTIHLLLALVRVPPADVDSMLRHLRVPPEELLDAALRELPPPRPTIPSALPVARAVHETLAHGLATERLVASAIGTPVRPIEPAHLLIGLMHGASTRWRPLGRRRPWRASVILGLAGVYAPDAQRWLVGWRHSGRLPEEAEG